jgi:hypothetical protein
MPRRRRRSKSLAMQSIELGMAVPEVIAHRMARMDSREFHRMGTEKLAAFAEAWTAMAVEAIWSPWFRPDAPLRILNAGMTPIRLRAVANAKRLRRRRRR